MASDGFNLPGSSYDELTKIIQAYKFAGDGADLAEVANLASTRRETISRSNKFLFDVGLLAGTSQNRKLTDLAIDLAQAMAHDVQPAIQQAWAAVVGESQFLSQIASAVRIRNGMDTDALHSHIAFTSGKPKSKSTATGARTVASILEAAGAIAEEDGEYVFVGLESAPEVGARPSDDSGSASPERRPSTATWGLLTEALSPAGRTSRSGTSINVELQVQVRVDASDLPDLGNQLREMMEAIQGPKADELPAADDE